MGFDCLVHRVLLSALQALPLELESLKLLAFVQVSFCLLLLFGDFKFVLCCAVKADGMSPVFYKDVKVVPMSSVEKPDAVAIPQMPEGASPHLVLLDGRAMATPFGNLMVCELF